MRYIAISLAILLLQSVNTAYSQNVFDRLFSNSTEKQITGDWACDAFVKYQNRSITLHTEESYNSDNSYVSTYFMEIFDRDGEILIELVFVSSGTWEANDDRLSTIGKNFWTTSIKVNGENADPSSHPQWLKILISHLQSDNLRETHAKLVHLSKDSFLAIENEPNGDDILYKCQRPDRHPIDIQSNIGYDIIFSNSCKIYGLVKLRFALIGNYSYNNKLYNYIITQKIIIFNTEKTDHIVRVSYPQSMKIDEEPLSREFDREKIKRAYRKEGTKIRIAWIAENDKNYWGSKIESDFDIPPFNINETNYYPNNSEYKLHKYNEINRNKFLNLLKVKIPTLVCNN